MTIAVPCSRASARIVGSGPMPLDGDEQRDSPASIDRCWASARLPTTTTSPRRPCSSCARSIAWTQTRPRTSARVADQRARPRRTRTIAPTRRRRVAGATPRATRGCSGGRARARSARRSSTPSSSTIGTRSRSARPSSGRPARTGSWRLADRETRSHDVAHAQPHVGQELRQLGAAALEHPLGLGVEVAEAHRDVRRGADRAGSCSSA